MRHLWLFGGLVALVTALSYLLMPVMQAHLDEIRQALIAFKHFCRSHPGVSYLLYSSVFTVVLVLGVPMACAVMLLAGVTYGFWEAALLITACRMAVAIGAFGMTRRMTGSEAEEKPEWLRRIEHHPFLGLLLMRLSPLPDNVVNCTMGVSSMRAAPYALISLLGMIPVTLLCVWMGTQLHSIGRFIAYVR